MTPDDALRDFFRELGLEHVTPFHCRALDTYRAQFEAMGAARTRGVWPQQTTEAHHLHDRLESDLRAVSLDALHGEAQYEDARRTAEKSARRRTA